MYVVFLSFTLICFALCLLASLCFCFILLSLVVWHSHPPRTPSPCKWARAHERGSTARAEMEKRQGKAKTLTYTLPCHNGKQPGLWLVLFCFSYIRLSTHCIALLCFDFFCARPRIRWSILHRRVLCFDLLCLAVFSLLALLLFA